MALDEFSTCWKRWPYTYFKLDRSKFWLCSHDIWMAGRLNFEPRTKPHEFFIFVRWCPNVDVKHRELTKSFQLITASIQRGEWVGICYVGWREVTFNLYSLYNLSNLLIPVMFSSDVRASTWNRERRNGKWRSIWLILIPMKRHHETQVGFKAIFQVWKNPHFQNEAISVWEWKIIFIEIASSLASVWKRWSEQLINHLNRNIKIQILIC